jgi:hypothetical protein
VGLTENPAPLLSSGAFGITICDMNAQTGKAAEAAKKKDLPAGQTAGKKDHNHVGADISDDLYAWYVAYAKEKMVTQTTVIRWALADLRASEAADQPPGEES